MQTAGEMVGEGGDTWTNAADVRRAAVFSLSSCPLFCSLMCPSPISSLTEAALLFFILASGVFTSQGSDGVLLVFSVLHPRL